MATEKGLSDCHTAVSTFFKPHCYRLQLKLVKLQKDFNKSNFPKDLGNNTLFLDSDDLNENYDFFTTKSQEAVNKYDPSKKKLLRGNHASFIDKEFRKATYTRSRLRNKFLKSPTKVNESLFKK